MRTPGPIDQTLRLLDQGAGQSDKLRAGAFASVTVRERLRPELYRITLGRLQLITSSSDELGLGTSLKVRVERGADGLVLRVLRSLAASPPAAGAQAGAQAAAHTAAKAAALTAEGPAAARILAAAGLPNDAAGRAAVSALLAAGIAPESRALARVRRAALREAGGDGGDLELAARMEAKGFPAEEEALEALEALADGRGRRLGGQGLGGRNFGEGQGGGAEGGSGAKGEARSQMGGAEAPPRLDVPVGAIDLSRDFGIELADDELPRVLAALMRSIATRAAGDANALSLYNHLRGPEGSWVLIPFRFSLDAVDFAGSIRLQLPYLRGGQGRFEAVFSASRGSTSEDWSFFVDFGGARAPSLSILAPQARLSAASSRRDALEAALAASGCALRLSAGQGLGVGVEPLQGGSLPALDFDA